MKFIIALSIVVLLSGCASFGPSPEFHLVDYRNRTEEQHFADKESCTKYHYQNGYKYERTSYFFECMESKGYKYEQVETAGK